MPYVPASVASLFGWLYSDRIMYIMENMNIVWISNV